MPSFAKSVQYSIASTILAVALLTEWNVIASGTPLFETWFPILCAVAFVGLVRRVSWGPVLASLVCIRLVLFVAASLIPNFDDAVEGTVLEHWFGFLPPVWLSFLIIVFAATLALLPIVLLSRCKAWFRPAWW